LAGRRMQQAIPQQRPSAVPQQQTLQAGLSGCTQDRAVWAQTGEQTAATLVLTVSKATTSMRNGLAKRFMAIDMYGRIRRKVQ